MLRLIPICILILFCNCNRSSDQAQQRSTGITLTDDLGRSIELHTIPVRVLALAPSVTEMLAAIIPDSQIIGRTQHCNYPEWVKNKPEINTYPLDLERILQLNPDLVFTVEGMTSLENAEKLQQIGIPVYYQKYETIDDIFQGMLDIGSILHQEEKAAKLVTDLRQEKINLLMENTSGKEPRVVALAWQDPIMVYGRNTLFTDKLKLAGGVNAIDTAQSNPYPQISREYLLKLDPDVIISRDFNFAAMDTTFFARYPELRNLKAYRNKRIFAVDPDLMERPNPRVLKSVKEIQSLIR